MWHAYYYRYKTGRGIDDEINKGNQFPQNQNVDMYIFLEIQIAKLLQTSDKYTKVLIKIIMHLMLMLYFNKQYKQLIIVFYGEHKNYNQTHLVTSHIKNESKFCTVIISTVYTTKHY